MSGITGFVWSEDRFKSKKKYAVSKISGLVRMARTKTKSRGVAGRSSRISQSAQILVCTRLDWFILPCACDYHNLLYSIACEQAHLCELLRKNRARKSYILLSRVVKIFEFPEFALYLLIRSIREPHT